MTPDQFIAKWRGVELKERSASQSHFNDLCALLDVPDPITADPTGDWFTFERGATKTTGGKGWADVWRRDCFAWEYKGRHANLDAAYAQVQRYAPALANPPLLIVSDMDRIVIRTSWTGLVVETHETALEDLRDARHRDRLRACFEDPDRLRPRKSRADLTEEAAGRFAGLAASLAARGHDPEAVAHFVNRLVFCMFAEDVGLLPNRLFERMLESCRSDPAKFDRRSRELFAAMNRRGGDEVAYERVNWFNGGLFDDDATLPLTGAEITALHATAKLNWSEIDATLLGTLFERGLDPAKRSLLGAHYTDAAKIMQIVEPVVLRPLRAEWAEVKAGIAAALAKRPVATADRLLTPADRRAIARAEAQATALHLAFLERLRAFRVLDPACGSGNFLALTLTALKDLEHAANLEAEALGLMRPAPQVGPEAVLGLKLNPYAAELARVSIWIAEIQWMRRNGFDAARDPILRPLGNVTCVDALLNGPEDAPTRRVWPEADAIVGNPPFLGDRVMRGELGDDYVTALRKAYEGDVPAGADFVLYWVAKGLASLRTGRTKRVGFVTTNSVRGGMNRRVLDEVANGPGFVSARADEPWTLAGAAVRVSMIVFGELRDGEVPSLDDKPVTRINADLTATETDLTLARKLAANRGVCVHGSKKIGSFDIDGHEARVLLCLPTNANGRRNSDVVTPVWNGADAMRRPTDRWIIDFGMEMTEVEASFYEQPLEIVRQRVKPFRDKNRNPELVKNWWLHGGPRPAMRNVLPRLARCIATPAVSKHRIFLFVPKGILPDAQLMVTLRDDDTTFGILHSRFHEVWSLGMGTFLGVGNDPRYTPSTTFETEPPRVCWRPLDLEGRGLWEARDDGSRTRPRCASARYGWYASMRASTPRGRRRCARWLGRSAATPRRCGCGCDRLSGTTALVPARPARSGIGSGHSSGRTASFGRRTRPSGRRRHISRRRSSTAH